MNIRYPIYEGVYRILTVEHAVEKAKRIKKRVYGNRIDSRG